jgi:hypothetical protein
MPEESFNAESSENQRQDKQRQDKNDRRKEKQSQRIQNKMLVNHSKIIPVPVQMIRDNENKRTVQKDYRKIQKQ